MQMVSLTSKQYRRTNLDGVARAWQTSGRTLTDLAAELGMSSSYLSQLLSEKRPIGDRTARKLEQRLGWEVGMMDAIHPAYFPLDPDERFDDSATGIGPMRPSESPAVHVAAGEISPGYLRLPQLDLPAGAGPGVEMEAEPDVVRWIDVAEQWAEKHFNGHVPRIRVLTARGDSMVGAGIMSGDLLFVDSGITRYDGDGFYILQFMDGWQVKRLRADVLSQQVEIVSVLAGGEDAKPVPPAKLRELRIGGKVAAWWTLRKH